MIPIILLYMTRALTLSPVLPTYPELLARHQALTFAPLGNTDYEMWVMGGGRDAPNPSSEVDTYEVFFHFGWSTFGVSYAATQFRGSW